MNEYIIGTMKKITEHMYKLTTEIETLTSLFECKPPKHNNDLTKICFNYACEDLDRSKDRCKRDKVCDMQIRKSSLES